MSEPHTYCWEVYVQVVYVHLPYVGCVSLSHWCMIQEFNNRIFLRSFT